MQNLYLEQIDQEDYIIKINAIINKKRYTLNYISKRLIYFIDSNTLCQKRVF